MKMKVCRECKKEILSDKFQTIQTKRKTTIYICNKCVKEIYGIEVERAINSQKST